MWSGNAENVNEPDIFYHYSQDPNSVLTFFLKDNIQIQGRIGGYFRNENDIIWQWSVIPISHRPFSLFDESIQILHDSVLRVYFHNSNTILVISDL
jgi:hypothetical protein